MKDELGIHIEGHIKIFDPNTMEVFVNKRNAIHYENFSISLVKSMIHSGQGFVYEMVFGNDGTIIDPTGIISYKTPNTFGSNAVLYNQTYNKVVDPNSSSNLNPINNYTQIRHVNGNTYTDIFITCLLDYSEPNGQPAFDTNPDVNNQYFFDEIGLKSYDFVNDGLLLTHVIFHPVQKSLNRQLQFDYTVRVQTVSTIMVAGA